MQSFAGNMLEVINNNGEKLLILSQTAFDCLAESQKIQLSAFCELIPIKINTIEAVGGGSARCMLAEIFLPKTNRISPIKTNI